MPTVIELSFLFVAIGTAVELLETSRRRLVGVRLERELRRSTR
jgi:hypothetical protein